MTQLLPLFGTLMPWLLFLFIIVIFNWLYKWAKQRRAAAIGLALLVQMFIPDPKVESTIKVVTEQKQKQQKRLKESLPKEKEDS